MAIMQELLVPSVVTKIVSRILSPGTALQNYFGTQIGGPNVQQVPGRAYSYDIFDNVRDIANTRMPNTGPGVVSRKIIGRQTNTMARNYDKMRLDYETLNNIRAIGQNAGVRDRMGMKYLEKQGEQHKRTFTNYREFLMAAFLTQGTISYQFSGDVQIPVLSLGGNTGFTTDFLIPSGNKSAAIPGLNPTGGGNIIDAAWSTAGTNIPLHLDSINKSFQQLVGAPLALAITDSTVWNHILNNTKLQAQGGSVNSVFSEYDMTDMKGPDGNPLGIFVATLRARPWLKWVIIDTGLNINGTYASFYDGTKVTFMIDPQYLQLSVVEGSEVVKTSPVAPAIEEYGFTFWLREWDEPAQVELHGLQNLTLEAPIPAGVMCAKVA
jgi:hypothetical protein